MVKPAGEIRSNNIKSNLQKNRLVLSINKNEKIIKFNKECERISGYNKNDVLNKSFFEILIPDRYYNQWQKALESLRKNKSIEDFKLPILTKNGHEIMISWSSFPIKIKKDIVGDIDFVGDITINWDDSEAPIIDNLKEDTKSEPVMSLSEVDKTISKLIKANEDLERKNKKLENKLKSKSSRSSNTQVNTSYSGKLVYSLADIAGGKKRRQEFERMMNELDEREKLLKKMETRLIKDKKRINETIATFGEWREKLETLESEVYNREKDIEERAKLLDSAILLGKSIDNIPTRFETDLNYKTEEDISEEKSINLIKEISGSAAIIQRGIFKKVNSSFADLIGYNINDLVEKSFFDFIAPEGLPGLEKYYLNRLKGEKSNDYNTVFLTSSDQTIPVKIHIKSTNYNGEKAEIAVVTKPGESPPEINSIISEPAVQSNSTDEPQETPSDQDISSEPSIENPGESIPSKEETSVDDEKLEETPAEEPQVESKTEPVEEFSDLEYKKENTTDSKDDKTEEKLKEDKKEG